MDTYFKIGQEYEHENSMDVFIKVMDFSQVEDVVYTTVYWYNKSQTGKPFLIFSEPSQIKINLKDIPKWRERK